MQKTTLGFGSILALIAVVMGAFASHSLKGTLTAESLSIWQTAVRYQMYHALALVLVSILMRTETKAPKIWLNISSIAFMVGVVLFSGSLYSLTITTRNWLGIITPIGGVVLIIGWICLTIFSLSSTPEEQL